MACQPDCQRLRVRTQIEILRLNRDGFHDPNQTVLNAASKGKGEGRKIQIGASHGGASKADFKRVNLSGTMLTAGRRMSYGNGSLTAEATVGVEKSYS